MAVVRVDNKLLREIKALLSRDGNKYQYPSIAAFVNSSVYEKLMKINNRKKK